MSDRAEPGVRSAGPPPHPTLDSPRPTSRHRLVGEETTSLAGPTDIDGWDRPAPLRIVRRLTPAAEESEPVDNFQEKVAFIWSVADLLRGDYKQSEYQKVILPLTVLRRLDSVLEPTKQQVLKRNAELQGRLDNIDPVLMQETGHQFYNRSEFTFQRLLDDPANVAANLRRYIAGFDTATRDVIRHFEFDPQVARLDRSNLLYQVV